MGKGAGWLRDLHKRWLAIRIVRRIATGRWSFQEQELGAKEELVSTGGFAAFADLNGFASIAADLLHQSKRADEAWANDSSPMCSSSFR